MADMLITGATVITMDPERRVIEDGAIAIDGDRIAAVGSRAEIEAAHSAPSVIDARRMVCLPGLVDVHGHAGHALVKTMDHDSFTRWRETVELIYAEGVDEEFWYAEASLAALERLKFGTTTGLSYFGGGRMLIRTDDPVYADRHCEAVSGSRDPGDVWPWARALLPSPDALSAGTGTARTNILLTSIVKWQRLRTSSTGGTAGPTAG